MNKPAEKSKVFIELCEKYGVDPNEIPEIMSLEAACADQSIDASKLAAMDVSMLPGQHQAATTATAELYVIAESLNRDPKSGKPWRPDWNNWDEKKWMPWVDMEVDGSNPTGFRFVASDYDDVDTGSTGGSRLCYRTSAICEFAFKHFVDRYRSMMTFSK